MNRRAASFFVALALFLAFALPVNAATYVQSHGVALSDAPQSNTAFAGFTFKLTNGSKIIANVTKDSADTSTRAYLRHPNGTYVANATFSGSVATFNYVAANDTNYMLLSGSDGAARMRENRCAAFSYPIANSQLSWTGGIYNLGSDGNCGSSFESITVTDLQSAAPDGYFNISAKQYLTNSTIASFNATSNNSAYNTTTDGWLLLPANLGVNNITVNVLGNYSVTFSCTLSAANTTVSCNATGIHDTKINISLRNAYTDASVSSFSGWLYHQSTGTNTTFTTTTGNVTLPGLRHQYTAFVDATGYSLTSANNATFTPNATPYQQVFYLYSNNSIVVNVYNATSGSLITQSVTVQVIGTNITYSNTTTTGTTIVENVRDGSYTVKVISSGFNTGTYTVTVADRSTQTLNAYLSASGGSTVVFSVSDLESGTLLQGASIGMYTSVNGTSQLVESRLTDITGRAQFSYTSGQAYSFIVTMSGYGDNEFSLDPIIFTSYDVKLRRTTSAVPETDYATVSVDYTPRRYYANQTNSVSVYFYSGNGTLQSYNATITYPGGTYTAAGNHSVGETFTTTLDLSSATPSQYVNVSYCYDTVYGEPHCYGPFSHRIIGAYYPDTIAGLKDKHYGMGLFERVLIVVLATIIVAGIVVMVGGAMAGGVAALFVMFFFVATGFIPVWAVMVSLVVGGFIVIKGGLA